MFKSKKIAMAKFNDSGSPDKLNRIVEGTTIEGTIVSTSNIRIDGAVKGAVSTEGRLVIGAEGYVEGEIVCQNADIEGKFNGTIRVAEVLTLRSAAKLNADIFSGKLAIEPGAEFSGTCKMGKDVDTNATLSSPSTFKGIDSTFGKEKDNDALANMIDEVSGGTLTGVPSPDPKLKNRKERATA